MNNEIKEILDKLQEQYNTDSKLGKEIANEFGNYQLNYKELTLLLDYITNLQNYYNDIVNKYEDLLIKYSNLQEEYKQADYDRHMNYELFVKENEENEKAIEYNKQIIQDIKDFYRPTSDVIYSGDTLIDIATNNINILQGSDEE